MNNCRFKFLSHFSLLLLFVLSGLFSFAQLPVLNKTGLQKASQLKAAQETAQHKDLLKLAKQKGWPLTTRSRKGRVAVLRGVTSAGLPYYVSTTDNIISAATIGTTSLWPGGSTGLALNGSSSAMSGKIAVWDEGKVRPTHVELTGRVTQVDGSSTLSDHSTHVSGTMIAAGVNPVAKGMAFGALQLKAYDYNNDESEMMAAAAQGLLVSNHSYAIIAGWYYDDTYSRWEWYGNPGDTVDIAFGLYDADTRVWDSIAYAAPQYLIAKAAGNNRGETGPDVGSTYYRMNAQGNFYNAGARPATLSSNAGYTTIATYGNAKNIMTIGAVNAIPGGYTQPSDVVLSDFTSLGPTGDGRIKPDLVADGVNVLSSISTADNAYDIYSGTSMATPASAGSAFLLQEYWSRMHSGNFMRAATLKGLLIHTADEAGTTTGPDYAFGWGLIDMKKAAALLTADSADKSQQAIETNLNADTATRTYKIIASGKMPVVATICWTDVPGTPVANPSATHNFVDAGIKLVNDLDLRITDSVTGTVYYPWVLNPSSPGSPATTGDNIRDNVEKVELGSNFVPGRTYIITVSHKNTLSGGSQAFSLLISGAGGTAGCTSQSTSGGASITNVTVGGLNYSPATGTCRNYTDYSTAGVASLPIGATVPISVTSSSCNSTNNNRIISVYIDYTNTGNYSLVAQSSATLAGTFTGSILVPDTLQTGTYARMRIIAEETTSASSVSPCGTYAVGETQDYKVTFTNPSVDVGVRNLAYPSQSACYSDSQLVSVTIHNYGTVSQSTGIPVTTTVKGSDGSTVATLTATCMDSIPAGSEVIFTYNQTIATKANESYSFSSATALSGDLNTMNDSSSTTVTTTGTGAAAGTASLYGTDSVLLTATSTASSLDLPLWYTSATGGTPVASGSPAYTTTIPSNRTYYLGVNDLTAKLGPVSKVALTTSGNEGEYHRIGYGYMKISTSVPLTLESAKLYVGHSGQVEITLATLYSFEIVNGAEYFSYIPYYSTTLDVYATKAKPDTASTIAVSAGDNTDTGATYLLNIPIPTPGNYILIVNCTNYSSLFMNTNISTDPYPFTLPGIMSITGNNYQDNNQSDSIATGHKYFFPFYNMGVKLSGCPSSRVAVSLAGGSNANISVYPNPAHLTNPTLQFNLSNSARTSVVVQDITGKKLMEQDLGVFSGFYSKQLNLSPYAPGIYVVLVYQGNKLVAKKEITKY